MVLSGRIPLGSTSDVTSWDTYRCLGVYAIYAPHRRVDPDLSVRDPEEAPFTPTGAPAVLADPITRIVLEADHGYAVTTSNTTVHVPINTTTIREEVVVDGEARYQRNEKALVLALMQMYIEGVSTRKVKDVTEELCGTSFSKSLVSRLAGELDSELERWRKRPLGEKAYPYLFVDARYEKARVEHRIVSEGVLIVYGVGEDGYREVLGVEVADTESEATYQELFRGLKGRGLRGVRLW